MNLAGMFSYFEMRYRDTQICYRAVEGLNSNEKMWAHIVSGLFCEDHACKIR